MANNENLIPIPGRLHSVATEGHVSGADEIYDDTQQKDQETINSELIAALGTGGSVDTRIANAVNAEKTRAEAAEGALDGRVDTLEEAVGTGGSVDSRISTAVNAAKSEIKGNATTACDTLGEAEALISAEAIRAQTAEANRYTKSETYTKEEVHNLVTTPSQEYVSVTATSQTTSVTDVLPATGAADTTYRVGNWDGTQYNDSVFSEYAWNGSAYIKLSTKSQIGEVYDISANHADTKYANLAAALGTNGANIPQSLRKGGMSVKFVQSSDNKYVQYRLMSDEFTTDITQWAIAEEGVYVEDSEFVCVKTDDEGKILWAIKIDGGIYYGAGCPQQVKDYIDEKIASLSLDEYEDIVAFLSDYFGSDTTLKVIIDGINTSIDEINTSISNLSNTKVDKEEGKSLIDSKYASSQSAIENPEFLEVTTDSEDKVLEGIQANGTKVIGGELNVGGSANINGDIRILGNMEVSGVSYKIVENPEWIRVVLDNQNHVLAGIRIDGNVYLGQNIPSEIKEYIENIQDSLQKNINAVDSKTNRIGAKVSIIGDSISTFDLEGYKVPGYVMQFPDGDVQNVNDTWWKQVINDLGSQIEVNASSSGSTASNAEIGFSPRVPLLGNPDVIFVALGTNDSLRGIEIGTIDYYAENPDLSKFAPAYISGIKAIKTLYPTAFVICLSFGMGDDYANTIKQIAQYYNCIYIDVRAEAGEWHPNKKQMSDTSGKILFEIQRGIKHVFGNYQNPEYIKAEVDEEGRILGGRRTNGKKFENIGFETPELDINKNTISSIDDKEERVEVIIDGEQKVISYRDKDGILNEQIGIKTSYLKADDIELSKAITSKEYLYIERPKFVDIYLYGDLPTDTSDARTPTSMVAEFKVNNETLFKANAKLSIQGHGTAGLEKHNFTLDLLNANGDELAVKFGDMVAVDSFHLKGYFTDRTHARGIGGAAMWRDMVKLLDYPYSKVNNIPFEEVYNSSTNAVFIADSKYSEDGFPCAVYFNSKFYGLYTVKLKKSRQNYAMDKGVKQEIFLDSITYTAFLNEPFDHTDWEVKNPKIKKYEEGGEITDAEVLANIERLFNFTSNLSTEYLNHADYINLPHWLLFVIFCELVSHWDTNGNNMELCTWDGTHWSILPYDLDNTCQYVDGRMVMAQANIFFTSFKTLYLNELRDLYTKLRKCGFIEAGNLYSYYINQVRNIPRDIYEKDTKKWGAITSGDTFGRIYESLSRKIESLDSIWLITN